MQGLEVTFYDQVQNVLDGKMADGRSKHALWALPKLKRLAALQAHIVELAYWTLCRATDHRRAREEFRTFLIWAIAAHVLRLTSKGWIAEGATRQVGWMAMMMEEYPDFAATDAFARKLMPTLVKEVHVAERRAARKDRIAVIHDVERMYRRGEDARPDAAVFDPKFRVLRYYQPAQMLTNPELARRWRDHLKALNTADADHDYWISIAHGQRLVWALIAENKTLATFEGYLGKLTNLQFFVEPTPELYNTLARALTPLRSYHPESLNIEALSPNPNIQELWRTYRRRADELRITLDRLKKDRDAVSVSALETEKVGKPRPFLLRNTDRLIGTVAALALLSFLLPALIILAPDFARTYVHVWEVVLGKEPDCLYPARRKIAGAFDCEMPDGTPASIDRTVPIPGSERRP